MNNNNTGDIPSGIRNFLQQIFKDKNDAYSLREVVVAILVIAMLVSWIAKQFFCKDLPDFMFYGFSSLIGAGCFGYSLEKKTDANT